MLALTYVFEAGVVVLADVVQLVDEDVVILAKIIVTFTHAVASEAQVLRRLFHRGLALFLINQGHLVFLSFLIVVSLLLLYKV